MKRVLHHFILLVFILCPFLVRAQVASFSVTPRSGCAPVSYAFTDGSTPRGTVSHNFFFYWDFSYVSGSLTDTVAVLVGTSTASTYDTLLSNIGYYNVVDSAYTSTTHNIDSLHNYLFVH